MNSVDNKKHKRRKVKKSSKTDLSLDSIAMAVSDETVTLKSLSSSLQVKASGNKEKVDDVISNSLVHTDALDYETSKVTMINGVPMCRSSNPYLAGQQCLLCRCERTDPVREVEETDNNMLNSSGLPQLPLWVCASCQKSMEDVEKATKLDSSVFVKSNSDSDDQDLALESQALKMMSESRVSSVSHSAIQSTPNMCHCTACAERRMIETEYQKETQELQKNWAQLRRIVWKVYREDDPDSAADPDDLDNSWDKDAVNELVHKLCHSDPHQLYRRLESQTRDYILSKKVKLLHMLTSSQQSPNETRVFIQKLLSVYHYLCIAASKIACIFRELEQEHLKKFEVTWELHDKHMFQSVVYKDPLIQSSLQTLFNSLRQGAANEKSSSDEHSFSNTLRTYIKFENEMSVVCVVWRECHQYIEAYNDEQEALKMKQKMLKEDWEFFKQQRRLLEKQVSKNTKVPKNLLTTAPITIPTKTPSTNSTCTAGLEERFTETIRHILEGSKNPQDERQCPRCNQKCCPCDECTITHMITCGIISPESVQNTSTQQMPPPFMHDPTQYIIDVTPPSMSSSGSTSSGSSSPILIERLAPTFDSFTFDTDTFQSCEEVADDSQSGDDATTDSKFADAETPQSPYHSDSPLSPELVADSPDHIPVIPTSVSVQNWVDAQAKVNPPVSGEVKACDCHHCITQNLSQSPTKMKLLEQCQCHVCMQQRGSLVSTALPHDMPAVTRPSEFHLYPHIHGHNVTNADTTILHPHLYALHNPHKVATSIPVNSKVPVKLDFDAADGIQDHMYHAYSEWENTRLLLGTTHTFPSSKSVNNNVDLLSISDAAFANEGFQSLVRDQSLLAKLNNMPDLIKNTEDVIRSTALLYPPPVTYVTTIATTQVPLNVSYHKSLASVASPKMSVPVSKCMMDHSHVITTTHPQSHCGSRLGPVGGNESHPSSNFTVPGSTIIGDKIICKHSVPTSQTNIMSQSDLNYILKNTVTTSMVNSTTRSNLRLTPKRAALPSNHVIVTTANTTVPPHTCSHMRTNNLNNQPHQTNHVHPQSNQVIHNINNLNNFQCLNNPNIAPPNIPPQSSVLYRDLEYDGQPDDDSLDDSCSERSSSTSTSNQKDGKYCDCCYCEFFGHSNPPSVPVSKNYAEMRDRLRQRLKKKNELKEEVSSEVVAKEEPPVTNDLLLQQNDELLGDKELDELLQYINGLDKPKPKNAVASTKSAKRARQKQKKADRKKVNETTGDKTKDESLDNGSSRPSNKIKSENDTQEVKTKRNKTKKEVPQHVPSQQCVANSVITDEIKRVTEKNLKNHMLVKDVKIEVKEVKCGSGDSKDGKEGKCVIKDAKEVKEGHGIKEGKQPGVKDSKEPVQNMKDIKEHRKDSKDGKSSEGCKNGNKPEIKNKNKMQSCESVQKNNNVTKQGKSHDAEALNNTMLRAESNKEIVCTENDLHSNVTARKSPPNDKKNAVNEMSCNELLKKVSCKGGKVNNGAIKGEVSSVAESSKVTKKDQSAKTKSAGNHGTDKSKALDKAVVKKESMQNCKNTKVDVPLDSKLGNGQKDSQDINIKNPKTDISQQGKLIKTVTGHNGKGGQSINVSHENKTAKVDTVVVANDNTNCSASSGKVKSNGHKLAGNCESLSQGQTVTSTSVMPSSEKVVSKSSNSEEKSLKTNVVGKKLENEGTEVNKSFRLHKETQHKASNEPVKREKEGKVDEKIEKALNDTDNIKQIKTGSLPNGFVMNSPRNARKKDKSSLIGTVTEKVKTETSGRSDAGDKTKNEVVKSRLAEEGNKLENGKQGSLSEKSKVETTKSVVVANGKNNKSEQAKHTNTLEKKSHVANNGLLNTEGSKSEKTSVENVSKNHPVASLTSKVSTSSSQSVKTAVQTSVPMVNGKTSRPPTSHPVVIQSRNVASTTSVTYTKATNGTSSKAVTDVVVVNDNVKPTVPMSPKSHELLKAQNKNKRRNKGKSKNQEDLASFDEIFMPKTYSDLECGELDDVERELEEFKRFCFDCPKPNPDDRVQVNVNLKDIFNKKKTGLGCT